MVVQTIYYMCYNTEDKGIDLMLKYSLMLARLARWSGQSCSMVELDLMDLTRSHSVYPRFMLQLFAGRRSCLSLFGSCWLCLQT